MYIRGLGLRDKSLLWDVVSAIPWHRIGCAAFPPPLENSEFRRLGGAITFVVLDLLRNTKILRCTVVMTLYREASGAGALLRLTLNLFCISHLVACVWFRIAVTSWLRTESDPEGNWLSGQDLLPRVEDNWLFEYVTSIYWVVTTMSTVGYGDILPITTFERGMTMLVMIGGVTFFATITGTITDVISSSARSTARFQDFMSEVEEFVRIAQVPDDQAALILQFFELKYPDKNIFNDQDIIEQLPQGLRRQLLYATYKDTVDSVPLFQTVKFTTLQQICGHMSIVNSIPRDVITVEGRIPDRLYIVRYGSVNMFRNNEWLHAAGPGFMFGEMAMFGLTADGGRWRSSIAQTQCELLCIMKEPMMFVVLENADLKGRFRSLAARHIAALKKASEGAGDCMLSGRRLDAYMSKWQSNFAPSDAHGVPDVDAHVASFRQIGAKGLRHVGDEDEGGGPVPVQVDGKGEGAVEEEGEALISHVLSIQGLPLFAPEVALRVMLAR